MKLLSNNDKKLAKSKLRIDTPYEAAIFEVHLPILSLTSHRARAKLHSADKAHNWPTTISVSNTALLNCRKAMEQRATGLERTVKMTFLEDRSEPEVGVLRGMAAAIREAQEPPNLTEPTLS